MKTSNVPSVPYAPPVPTPSNETAVPTQYFFRSSYFPVDEIIVSTHAEVELGRRSYSRPPSKLQRCEFLSPIVSLIHARLGADEKGVFLVDVGTYAEGSTHGTFLNGSRIKSLTPHYLTKGDLISLGNPQCQMSVTLILVRRALVGPPWQ